MTKIHITPKWKDVKPMTFYVYIHRRSTDLTPFYVGMGSNQRAWNSTGCKGRTQLWKRCALKNGVTIEICQEGLSKEDAYLLEMWIIAKFKNDGIKLYNLSDGGEGSTGCAPANSRRVLCSNGMRFSTTGEAASWVSGNSDASMKRSLIYMCCSGKIKSAYGLSWWYEGEDEVVYVDPKKRRVDSRRRSICCSNGMKFESTEAAAAWLRDNGWPLARYIGINAAIRGRNDSAYGLAWWYEGEKEKIFVDSNVRRGVSVSNAHNRRRSNAEDTH